MTLIVMLVVATRVETARRPHNGGALRVEISAVVGSLDLGISTSNPPVAAARDRISALIEDHRTNAGALIASAPFKLAEWEPGKHIRLLANEDASGGRPFLDSIEILMGRSAHDRLVDLELNKTDLAEIPPEQARRAADRGVRLSSSQPDELLALVFPAGRAPTDDARVREALARSIDRGSIVNFILQKNGELAGGLLPQWSSGTAFLFPTAADSARAKELYAQIASSPKLVLGYDSADSLEQSVAERIVVNAREVGISLVAQAIPATAPVATTPAAFDARLVRLCMTSSLPRPALLSFLATLGPMTNIDASVLPDPATPEDIYNRERAIVDSHRIVPLVWLPEVYGLSARVRNWKAPGPGEAWPLADVWLDGPPEAASEKEKP